MKPSVVVLTPVLDRPQRAAPLAESLYETTGGHARLLFLCSPGDHAEIEACQEVRRAKTLVVPFERRHGDYARKINYGVAVTESEWVFQGADDLRFHPGWLEHAIEAALRRPGKLARVIGTQDLGNRAVIKGRHSTHSLVHRTYAGHAVIDVPGHLMFEGYRHNFVDTEMVETARSRGEFQFAREAVVEHLHPNWRKGEMDATYELGLGDFREDQKVFHARRALWRGSVQERRAARRR